MTIRRKGSEDTDEVHLDDGTATLRLREVETEAVISRRGVLWRAGLATAAGVAALTVLDEQRAQAATGGNFLLGDTNDAATTTTLKPTAGLTTGFSSLMSLDGSTNITVSTLDVTGPAGGDAVAAHVSGGGTGVAGSSLSGTGVAGSSGTGVGVVGTSTSNDAVHGTATADGKTGVLGTDTSPTGGTGIYGTSTHGVGVRATSGGTALSVSGKTHFSRSGAGTVGSGKSTKTISVSGVTASSLVLVTLQTEASGTYVTSAVPASGTFTIHLNKNAPTNIKFAWFVVSG